MGDRLVRKGLVLIVLGILVLSRFGVAKVTNNNCENGWYIYTAAEGDFMGYSSLALDSNNYPHIIGTSHDGHYIQYVRWNGSEWEHFDKIYEEDTYPYSNSLALDSEDNPHICYYAIYYGYCYLKYATLNGTKWDITDIDYGDVGFAISNSINIDTQNNPHVAYTTDYYTCQIKYAKFNGYNWEKETVDDTPNSSAGDVDFALDSNDYPHIAYYDGYDQYNGILRYARWNGSGWEKEIVDDSAQVGVYVSLYLDNLDHPHISYVRRQEGSSWWYGNIKYAYRDEQNWTIEEVTTGNTTGWGTSIALDSNGNPCITYIDGVYLENLGNIRLIYTSRIDGNWENETVDSGSPNYPSLAIDSNDNLYIGYCDSDGIRFATTVNLFNNQPPNAPTINGRTSGKAKKEYYYTFVTIDPDGDNISSYIINWGDGTQDIVHCSVASGKKLIAAHKWNETGTYIIKARAKDTDNLWGPWGELTVKMPKDKAVNFNSLLLKLVERFPLLESLLLMLQV